jgi:hypothetical protein
MIPIERIERLIFVIRGHKVMLDADLSELYGVETKALNRAFARNRNRFPSDFAFRLSDAEFQDLRCQFDTSRWGGRRYLPYAFTEQGVAMLSGILHSRRAVQGISRSCARSFSSAGCWFPTLSWLGNWKRWRKSTTPGLKSFLMLFES